MSVCRLLINHMGTLQVRSGNWALALTNPLEDQFSELEPLASSAGPVTTRIRVADSYLNVLFVWVAPMVHFEVAGSWPRGPKYPILEVSAP